MKTSTPLCLIGMTAVAVSPPLGMAAETSFTNAPTPTVELTALGGASAHPAASSALAQAAPTPEQNWNWHV